MKNFFLSLLIAAGFISCFSQESFAADKKILVEGATGTWCSWCPGMDALMEHFHNKYGDDVITIKYFDSRSDLNFCSSQYNPILNVSSKPSMFIDRAPDGYSVSVYTNQKGQSDYNVTFNYLLRTGSPLEVDVRGTLDTGKVTAKAYFDMGSVEDDYKVMFVVVADGFVAPQNNGYASWSTDGNYIPELDFYRNSASIIMMEHNDVAVAASDFNGINIKENAKNGAVSCELVLPSLAEMKVMRIVAIVTDAKGKAVNARESEITKSNSIYIESLTLTSGNELTMTTGDTKELEYEAAPDGWAEYDSVVWTSSDPEIATVSDKGVVTAVAEGKCKITASSKMKPDVKAEIEVTVEKDPTSGVSGSTIDSASIRAGEGEIIISGKEGEASVYNIEGALISKATLTEGEVRISVPAGIYIVKSASQASKVIVK